MSDLLLNLAAWTARLAPNWLKQMIYRSEPLARLIRRSLNRAAPQGLTRVTVAAGALIGAELELDLQSEKDYWLGTYEMDLQAALPRFVRPGMVAYDLGANIGYLTIALARAVGEGGHVYAFEALPDNLARLRKNLALNHLAPSVTVIPAAVVDRPGPVQFLQGPSGGTGKVAGAAGRSIRASDAFEVTGVSLDDFAYHQGHPPPQVIKMDIEGGEILALQGMSQLLTLAKPTLLMELHGADSIRAAWELLRAAGYQIARMAPGYPSVESWEALDWKAYLVGQGEDRDGQDE